MKSRQFNLLAVPALTLASMMFFMGCHKPALPGKGAKAGTSATGEAKPTSGTAACDSTKALESAISFFENDFKTKRSDMSVADIGLQSKVRIGDSLVSVRQVAIVYSKNPGKALHSVFVREDSCQVAVNYEALFVTANSEMAKDFACGFKNLAKSDEAVAFQQYTDVSGPYELDSGVPMFEMYKASANKLTLVLIPKNACDKAQTFEKSLGPASSLQVASADQGSTK